MAEKREVFRFSFLAKSFSFFSLAILSRARIKAHQFPHRHRRELERSQVSSFHSRTTHSPPWSELLDYGGSWENWKDAEGKLLAALAKVRRLLFKSEKKVYISCWKVPCWSLSHYDTLTELLICVNIFTFFSSLEQRRGHQSAESQSIGSATKVLHESTVPFAARPSIISATWHRNKVCSLSFLSYNNKDPS